jgi:hypothetical protein
MVARVITWFIAKIVTNDTKIGRIGQRASRKGVFSKSQMSSVESFNLLSSIAFCDN